MKMDDYRFSTEEVDLVRESLELSIKACEHNIAYRAVEIQIDDKREAYILEQQTQKKRLTDLKSVLKEYEGGIGSTVYHTENERDGAVHTIHDSKEGGVTKWLG